MSCPESMRVEEKCISRCAVRRAAKIFIHYALIAGGFSVILLPETNTRKAICFV